MGEFIAEMQERLLPEYEQMKNYNVFQADQVREIVSRRERLFLKINRSHQTITDYLEFILYEKHMHLTIEDKEKKMNVKLTGLKTSIATRIMRLYREALDKFTHDRRLWSNWIKFSKKSNPVEVAGIYEKMLLYHGDVPDYWVDAAMWLYEYNRLNIDRVKDILLRGLQRHPDSAALNKCFFDIMLKEAALGNNERNLAENTLSEQDIKLERVEAVYRNSMANITQLDYFVKLLESCEDHQELTGKLQRLIIDDMQEKFPREPGLWDLLAQRELRGFHLGDLEDEDLDTSDEEPASKKSRSVNARSLKRRIQLCVTVYKSAVEELQTPEMWNMYLDAMLALNTDGKSERILKQQCLADALQAGHRSQMMGVKHYSILRKMLCTAPGGREAAVTILTEALKNDSSVEMHELLLATHIQSDSEPLIYEMFNQIQKNMGSEALPLWRSVILYYNTRQDQLGARRLDEIYGLACKSAWPEFAELRSDYIRYLWRERSIEEARKEYAKLAIQPPMSLALHRQMIQLESSAAVLNQANLKYWRMCYDFMACYFGKTEPRVWVEYLAFERDHGETKNIALLTQRAISTLEPQYVAAFEAERALAYVGASI
ncbi:U3 small nucleolar RNA-associated protein 6 homolog [Drosophila subpulchrella]|uniref:U3 small nucleolar RNA-associated protein 6 homolog n=1 Tax=Drosophila subpulchrella TaxID=1486046 RepID=UPI0018A181E7|nr:U3 small nucleolar RNA-associated protein 6 homolog [Drosophila subpulchrella]